MVLFRVGNRALEGGQLIAVATWIHFFLSVLRFYLCSRMFCFGSSLLPTSTVRYNVRGCVVLVTVLVKVDPDKKKKNANAGVVFFTYLTPCSIKWTFLAILRVISSFCSAGGDRIGGMNSN